MGFGEQRLKSFFATLWAKAKGTKLDAVSVGADPLKFSFKLERFPSARDEFRAILRGQLTTVLDLVNRELQPEARKQLAHDGFDDIVLIVDDLDRNPQKVLVTGA